MTKRISEKEQFLLEMIRKNPYVSQQELAKELGLSRPTIANMISALIKKGFIVGRAYVLAESDPVICIGGAHIMRKYELKDQIQLGTGNPVHVKQSSGGVARNIAENLGRLGLDVSLLTACGIDSDWSFIESASGLYMKLDRVLQHPGTVTSSFTSILDRGGEIVMALADMEAHDLIDVEYLQKQEDLLSRAKCLIVDLTCPEETLQWLIHFAKTHRKPFMLIATTSPNMNFLPEDLSGVTWLITNRAESESHLHFPIRLKRHWEETVERWLNRGITNVGIIDGSNGAAVGNLEDGLLYLQAMHPPQVMDVTGAEEAFGSAIIYAWLAEKSLQEIVQAGIVNAARTWQSPYTVRQDLSAEQLENDLAEQI